MSDHDVTLCDGCGQKDDHPKCAVYGPVQVNERTTVMNPSYHHDCLPQALRETVAEGAQHAVVRAAIEAADSGVHGDELRELIQSMPSDNEVEPEVVS